MNKTQTIDNWIKNHGAANFDLKKRDIILYDGGLFSVEKKIKRRLRSKFVKIKKGKYKGYSMLKHIKGKKVKYEDYTATFWFEELDETINYLRSMKRMLNKIGYKTGRSIK